MRTRESQMWLKRCQRNKRKVFVYNTMRSTLERRSGGVESDLSCIAVILVAQGLEELQVQPRLWRSHLGLVLVATGRSCWGTQNFADC